MWSPLIVLSTIEPVQEKLMIVVAVGLICSNFGCVGGHLLHRSAVLSMLGHDSVFIADKSLSMQFEGFTHELGDAADRLA